jgi:uncharacterized membrane protein YccF (DUF307 family)
MTTTVIRQERGANLLLRAVYFLVFGLWFSAIWATIAWVLCVTIIGLPFGLWMLNRLPQVTTLRPQRGDLLLTASGELQRIGVPQLNLLLRALWFVLVGWWLSALWMAAAWALCAVIIGLPVGFWMFDRVPAVVTLGRS